MVTDRLGLVEELTEAAAPFQWCVRDPILTARLTAKRLIRVVAHTTELWVTALAVAPAGAGGTKRRPTRATCNLRPTST